jgi:hypothetical protein
VDGYFLNVLHGRDATAPPLEARVKESSDRYIVQLGQAGVGRAVVVLSKGMASKGGTVAIDGAAPVALERGVQQIVVTDDGPSWVAARALHGEAFEPLD